VTTAHEINEKYKTLKEENRVKQWTKYWSSKLEKTSQSELQLLPSFRQ
jgi:predicted GIY-YIG superfamily endonuclease